MPCHALVCPTVPRPATYYLGRVGRPPRADRPTADGSTALSDPFSPGTSCRYQSAEKNLLGMLNAIWDNPSTDKGFEGL